MKKILLIEDSQHHVDSAKKFFADKDVELKIVCNFDGFLGELRHLRANYDGILSDIFIPYDDEQFTEEVPAGVGIFSICSARAIPCILVTAGHHHGQKYHWIGSMVTRLVGDGRHVLVDTKKSGHYLGDKELDEDSPEKNWSRAYESLLKEISRIPVTG